MPIQIIQEKRNKSTGERFSDAFSNVGQQFGQGVGQYLQGQQAQKLKQAQQQETAQFIEQMTGQKVTGREDPEMLKAIATQIVKNQSKEKMKEKEWEQLGKIFSPNQGNQFQQMDQGGEFEDMGQGSSLGSQFSGGNQNQGMQQQQNQGGIDFSNMSDDQIAAMTLVNPSLGRVGQHAKDVNLREKRANKEFEQNKFEADRTYHSQQIKNDEEHARKIRESIPNKELALQSGREAIEQGNFGAFSPDNLAQYYPGPVGDLLRTSKGAQLALATKTNVIGNLSKVSSKAQNVFLEKMMSSAFAQSNKTKEANLTVQEGIEAELAMDQAYLKEYERISNDDMDKYGFVRKGIGAKAEAASKSERKQIMRRTSYRVKELHEKELGLFQNEVGKNVVKGTPLTMGMAKLYKNKYGDKAIEKAEENGYYIPSVEEYKIYTMRPQEYGEANNF